MKLGLLLNVVTFIATPQVVQGTPPCHYPAQCVPLENSNVCFGVRVSYSHTSLDLANDSNSLADVQKNLLAWKGLQGAPRCWDVIQRLLCAIYMPECKDSHVAMYRRDLCQKTREPCRIVSKYNDGKWPSFLQCDQPYFTTDESCTAETYTSMKFHRNATCMHPLVKTDNEASFYEDIDGCGIQCDNPMFTANEHSSLHVFIAIMASICLVSTLATALTFLIDWKNSRKYPSVIIFFINVCFFMGSIGWLAQFAGDAARKDIVCRRDGTARLAEPLVGEGQETASCTVVFFIVYYFMMAGVTWFVILAYSWHVSFKKLQNGSVEDKLKGKIAYFHILAWALPLVTAIIAMSLQKVDGDSLSGICFVGYVDGYARGFLVLFPITLALCIGLFFLLQGVVRLYQMRKGSSEVRNNRAKSKITATILRLGIFSILAFVFVTLTLVLHIYDFRHKSLWEESFRNYTVCTASARFDSARQEADCELYGKPSLVSVYLNIFAYFGAGIMMSSWTWTKASKETWTRFIRRVFRMPTNKPVKLKSKHRMIALAFQRKQQKKGRKLSLDFHTSHDDPLGMKMDLGSVTSNEMSSAWLEAMPKLVKRRGGMALPMAGTLRRYSDSDISSMIASRRASLDSQLSEAESTLKAKVRKRGRGDEHRSRRDFEGINPADIAAFNARRGDGNFSQKGKDDPKKHFGRRLSDTSRVSNASIQNVSIECEDTMEQYIVSSSKRSSVDSNIAAGLTNTAQLEQLTLATYSVFTSSALRPELSTDTELPQRAGRHRAQPSTYRNDSRGGSSHASRSTSGKSGKLQTPNSGYVNGALDDAGDVSDISV